MNYLNQYGYPLHWADMFGLWFGITFLFSWVLLLISCDKRGK